MINRKYLAGGFLIAIGLSLGFGIGSLRAEGVPQINPLFYSGTLTESGQPVTGARNIRVSLWKHETSTMVADRTCETVANNTPVEGGRFRVALDATCVTAVHAEPEQWVEVLVGSDIIGTRAKLGAVPYALEAAHATSAEKNFLGFSARTSEPYSTTAGIWQKLTLDSLEFNTLGDTYDPASGTFTANRAGYYRFSFNGHSGTPTPGNDTRIGFAFYKNGVPQIVAGGQLSAVDSPLPVHAQILHLAIGDTVGIWMYCPVAISIGNANPNMGMWLQGEYLGT